MIGWIIWRGAFWWLRKQGLTYGSVEAGRVSDLGTKR